jgi:hypothetical protein
MSVRIAKRGSGKLCVLACCLALFATHAGCEARDGQSPTPAFMPGWDEARQSLELSAWRDAPSPLPASFDTRAVKFVDKRRKPNQRLLAFQILGQSDIENARQFTVRLTLEGEESPQLDKYNVLGRDPVWIFRLQDYEMFSHWEMDMQEPAPNASEKPKEAAPADRAISNPPNQALPRTKL